MKTKAGGVGVASLWVVFLLGMVISEPCDAQVVTCQQVSGPEPNIITESTPCYHYPWQWDYPASCQTLSDFYKYQAATAYITGYDAVCGQTSYLRAMCKYWEAGPCNANLEIPKQLCTTETPGDAGGGESGPTATSPEEASGKPVSIINGAMFFTHTDATVGSLVLSRSFDTDRIALSGRYGAFGPGWNASFEIRLTLLDPRTLEARRSDGAPQYYFDGDGDGFFEGILPRSSASWIVSVAGGYRRVFRAGGEEVYDAAGTLISVTSPGGLVTTYSRDAQGRLTSITRLGRPVSIVYSGNSTQPEEILGPAGEVLASYAYDPQNRLAQVTYPDGSGYRYGYDSAGNVVSLGDLAGKLIEAHEFIGHKAMTSEVGNGVGKLTFTYGANTTTVTDALGNTTVYEIALAGGIERVTKITGPCSSCGGGGGNVQEWTYDIVGNITSYKNGLGKTWVYTYNSTRNLLTETDPLNRVTTYTYDSQGRVLTRTGPDGSLTTYTYGPAGPLTLTEKVTATEDRTTTITYNGQGQPATITDPRGKTTTLDYTAEGDLSSVTDPLSHSASFGYDGLGRRTTVTDALNHTTTTTYDGRGRVKRITSPDSTHTDFTYDLGGRRTKIVDPLGRATSYVYDLYGRLESVVDPMAGVTRYGYDLMSNLVSLTDAKGQTTAFEYDAYNRVKKMTYPGGAFESFTYDAGGRLATKTDRKAVVTTYSYDDLGRLTGKSYSDGTTPPVSYTYDSGGRLATAANGTDTLTWAYDLAGQVLSEQSTKNASTVAYTYDTGGDRLSVSLDGQVFVSYAYDDASRLTSISRSANVFGFGYDNANRRTSMTYPNGITTTYAYDTVSRLTNLAANLGQTPVTSFSYTYDAAGNRMSKAQLDYTETYSYDPLYRLTTVERTGAGANRWLYGYDKVGNRTSEQIGDAVSTSSYNEKNQLLSRTGGGPMRWRGTLNEPGNVAFTTVTVNGKPARMLQGNVFEAILDMTPGNNTVTVQATDVSGNTATKNYQVNVTGSAGTYTYDANGNLIQKVEGADTWTYEWNAENELTRVLKNGAEQARFAYDPKGRRVEKVAGGQTTSYAYESEDILRDVRGPSTLKYVHGPGIDEPMATDDGSSLSYFLADGLGSVLKTTNSVGAVTLARQYDAWGSLQAGATANGHAFTGREWDPDTGLYYYRARYYDSQVARFVNEDPIGFGGGENFYAYVSDGPVNRIDPIGLYDPHSGGVLIGCFQDAFEKGERAGRAIGYRVGHCTAACEVGKCGAPQVVVKLLGWGVEWIETATCMVNGFNCHSARAPIDYQDNETGYTCPAGISCEERCSAIVPPKKTRAQYGPHCKGPCRERNYE
jgi:RHS repeat-associated protein